MRRGALAVAAVVLLLGSSGCGDDDDGDEGGANAATTTSTPATASTVAPPATTTTTLPVVGFGGTYVALGSSIASGFGIAEQSTDCGRSTRSYPNLVASARGLELVDVTCGAATIPDVVDTPQGANPPQLEALTLATDLVTVSVGGNDITYNGTALACADPASVCTAPPDLDERVAATGPALVAMIDAIRSEAPHAVVVLVTYPREVPEVGCPELSMTEEERALVADMGARLEQVFVDVAASTGVVLIDPYVEPGDHTGCAPPEDRWTAGAVADDGFAFHPTALGHEVMAAMVLDALSG